MAADLSRIASQTKLTTKIARGKANSLWPIESATSKTSTVMTNSFLAAILKPATSNFYEKNPTDPLDVQKTAIEKEKCANDENSKLFGEFADICDFQFKLFLYQARLREIEICTQYAR